MIQPDTRGRIMIGGMDFTMTKDEADHLGGIAVIGLCFDPVTKVGEQRGWTVTCSCGQTIVTVKDVEDRLGAIICALVDKAGWQSIGPDKRVACPRCVMQAALVAIIDEIVSSGPRDYEEAIVNIERTALKALGR